MHVHWSYAYDAYVYIYSIVNGMLGCWSDSHGVAASFLSYTMEGAW